MIIHALMENIPAITERNSSSHDGSSTKTSIRALLAIRIKIDLSVVPRPITHY